MGGRRLGAIHRCVAVQVGCVDEVSAARVRVEELHDLEIGALGRDVHDGAAVGGTEVEVGVVVVQPPQGMEVVRESCGVRAALR